MTHECDSLRKERAREKKEARAREEKAEDEARLLRERIKMVEDERDKGKRALEAARLLQGFWWNAEPE